VVIPAPKAAGQNEAVDVPGLIPGRTYFFGLTTKDENGNTLDENLRK
jgi:hypothetical protein